MNNSITMKNFVNLQVKTPMIYYNLPNYDMIIYIVIDKG